MEDIKELVFRLKELDTQINELQLEYNKIVKQLWEQIPSLKDDVNIQMKGGKK